HERLVHVKNRRVDLTAEKSWYPTLGADGYILDVFLRESAACHHGTAHHLVERTDFLNADLAAFEVFAALDVALDQHRLGELMRVGPEHLCPRPPRRRDNRRIGACAGDSQSASHAPGKCLVSDCGGGNLSIH